MTLRHEESWPCSGRWVTVLALGLLVWTGWLGEAGFNRISQWRNLRLLLFPLLVCALTLSGGLFGSGPASLVSAFLTALVATFGEEIVFRGLLWRVFVPTGPVRAVILTSCSPACSSSA